jgi:deoxyhypusine synthase
MNCNGKNNSCEPNKHMINEDDGIYKTLIPLKSLDLSKCETVNDLVKQMAFTSFGGRQVGEAADVLEAMVRDKKCLKVLTLSGAMTMAKMGLVICDMIDHGLVDVIISTGALMAHGFVEGSGMTHFKNPGNVPDEVLEKGGYDRVYDTIELEKNLDDIEDIIDTILDTHDKTKTLSSFEFSRMLGKYLVENTKGRGVLKSAYLKNVPVFIPAFTDSEMGLDLGIYNKRMRINGKEKIRFDPMLDLEKYTELVIASEKIGIFTVGGGVPRNWAQQVGPYLDAIRWRLKEKKNMSKYFMPFKEKNPYNKSFIYGVRICPESVHWGGLSGCTYSEGVSWGKFWPVKLGGRYAEVIADATIAWPIIVKAVLERLGKPESSFLSELKKKFKFLR